MKQVLLECSIHEDGVKLLKKEVEVIGPIPNHTEVIALLKKGVHGLIVSSALPVTEELMAASPLLEAVGRPGVGVDNVDLPGATNQGVLAVYTPDAPTESTAEHAVALIMALAKRVVAGDGAIRRSGWAERGKLLDGMELLGKTLGVVGLGRIGGRVAEICGRGLRMKVIVYDPYITQEQAAACGAQLVSDLPGLLRQSDFVTVHTPLNDRTRGMIGAKELALLKPTAYLINTSRGPVVDEEALLAVLRAKQIAGAGIDVYKQEPIPFPHPLLELPNVVVTPHIASATQDGMWKMGVVVAEEMLAALRGDKPRFIANPQVWERGTRVSRAGKK